MPKDIELFSGDGSFSVTSLLINLILGVVLSIAIRWHFQRFGSTLSNREEFSRVIPFILLTVILVISVVKSSLALSLGLVGALSIVRFRTPIKEPEELAYLFIAIGAGLGLGANQSIATLVAVVFILIVMASINRFRASKQSKGVYLSIDLPVSDGSAKTIVADMTRRIMEYADTADLRRFDVRNRQLESTFYVSFSSVESLAGLTDALQQDYPESGITYLDQNQIPNV